MSIDNCTMPGLGYKFDLSLRITFLDGSTFSAKVENKELLGFALCDVVQGAANHLEGFTAEEVLADAMETAIEQSAVATTGIHRAQWKAILRAIKSLASAQDQSNGPKVIDG